MTEVAGPRGVELWARIVGCQGEIGAVLQTVAEHVVQVVGDGCVLTTVSDDGASLDVVATAHRDPEVGRAMRATASTVAIGEGVAGTAAADRQVVVLNRLLPQAVAEATPERFQDFAEAHPMYAMAIVPLVVGGDLLGTLGAVRTSPGRPYEARDVRALRHLAQHAALAIADARRPPEPVTAHEGGAAFRSSFDAMAITTLDGRPLAVNPAACTLVGRSAEDLARLGAGAVLDLTDPAVAAALDELVTTGHARHEVLARRADGSTVPIDLSATVYVHEGRSRVLVVGREVSAAAERDALRRRVAELEQAADHDALTGLWNRRGFFAAAERTLADADRHERTCALLFVDVDGLKAINDHAGHAVGDEALVAVGSALERSTRGGDLVCRLGGDEFLMLALDAAEDDAAGLVDRVLKRLQETEVGRRVDFSWGVAARAPGSGATLDALVAAADQDMYQQKVLNRIRQHQRPT